MLSKLRLQLTAVYLAVAALLVLALGGATYGLVNFYFESATDLAMQRKMAQEFRTLNLAVPAELAEAEARSGPARAATATPLPVREREHDDDDEHKPTAPTEVRRPPDDDVELAAITPLYADASGAPIVTTAASSRVLDQDALAAARLAGHDHRTVTSTEGDRVRVLTYFVGASASGPAFVQLARPLADQDRIRNSLLVGLLALGLTSITALGALSWWLAGRSILPTQRAWEQQRQFVANASHELRAPLTLLRANAETLQQNMITPDAADASIGDSRELTQNILDACDHTDRLVGDLLLLSRLDAGQLPLAIEDIDAAALLADMVRHIKPLADGRDVHMDTGASTGVLRADPTRLRQVLLIVLDNALRHTPAGGLVTLDARPQGQTIKLSVSDTGAGIAPKDLPRVFERFYQADAAHSTKGSAGLGLAIAKGLVDAMHGSIAISSTMGKGTQVSITLPVAKRS